MDGKPLSIDLNGQAVSSPDDDSHGIYQTSYRYRGRSIGHDADNDARILSIGLLLVDDRDTQWHVHVRYGELNSGDRRLSDNLPLRLSRVNAPRKLEVQRP